MNREANNFHEDEELVDAVQRYEEMIKTGEMFYFDVFQFEHIIDSFIEEGKFYHALKVVETALTQHPSSFNILSKKAQIHLNMGEISLALSLSDRLLQIEDTNQELYLLKGSSHLLLGEKKQANISFNNALKYSFENKDETLYNIGFSYEHCGNIKKAIRFFSAAHNMNPANEIVIYELAYCYDKIREHYKSIECYNKYLDLDTFSDSAWFNLGIVYNKLKKHYKAVEAYEYALTINEDFPNALFNLGNTYLIWEKYDKAIEALNKYIEFDESNDEIFLMLGECYSHNHDYDQAFSFYQKAISINKSNDKAWYLSGVALKMQKEYLHSLVYVRKALIIDSNNVEYLYFVAKICVKLNMLNDAIDAFESLCELAPKNITFWLKYSKLLNDKGLKSKAISILNKAQIKNPGNSLVFYRLAAYYLESMEEEKAFKYLKEALINDWSKHKFFFRSYPEAILNNSVKMIINEFKTENN